MGYVYVATQLATGRQRALKVMRADLVQDPKLRQRFEQEAKVGARIESDHVVDVVDAGVDGPTGMPWLAMELLEGENLGERVTRAGAMSVAEARDVLDHVAHALSAAHREGVVHRDLKPENVFVANPKRANESTVVKVLDFGIAKVVADARPTGTAPIGTLLWMAPEQAESDGAIGPATDVWSFGLLAFYVLAGRSFWDESASAATMIKRLVVEPIPKASERAAKQLPRGFDAWFSRCVARNPKERFASIDEANRELGRILDANEVSLAATEQHAAPRRASPVADTVPAVTSSRSAGPGPRVLVGAIAAIAAVALFVFTRSSPTSEPSPAPASAGSASAAPGASSASPTATAHGFKLDPDDTFDHDTVWRAPLGDSPRRGGKEPLVTIVEFGDFECPFTRAGEDTMKQILTTYGDDVALVWKDTLPVFHPVAEPAARLARFARAVQGDEGFWRAHDQLFSVCAANDPAALPGAARELGLPLAKARAAIDGPSPESIERDNLLAADLGAVTVPSFFFNGRQVLGSHPFAEVRRLVDEEIARARALVAAGVPRAGLYDAIQKDAVPKKVVPPVDIAFTNVNVPVLTGAHAVLDVHQFGDETDFFTGLSQPFADWLLQEYGDRIRFFWHWSPNFKNANSVRIAEFGRSMFALNGSAVFWKLHRSLMDNAPWDFEIAGHNPRGLADDALLSYAKQAGANALYATESPATQPDGGSWTTLRADLETIRHTSGQEHTGFFYAGGYFFGGNRFEAKRLLDALVAERR
jgi:serine/threonine protein kinase